MSDWISVNDSVPEYGKKVIVSHCNGITIAYHDGYNWIGKQGQRHYLSSVTHWMPLPEPPKESDTK